jgi:intracellular septation protein
MSDPSPPQPLAKLALELGPLALFFLANVRSEWFRPLIGAIFGATLLDAPNAAILIATTVFMAAMLVSLLLTRWLYGRLPVMPLVSGIVVLVFGGLTIALQDETFIKLKPTIINTLFGTILLGGLAFGKPLLPYVLDAVFDLDREGWRKLTFRWGVFFLALALLNEFVWRTQTTDFWVAFKVWGVMPITFAFALAQMPLAVRHARKPADHA